MMLCRLLSTLLVLLLVPAALTAKPVRNGNVQVELVAAATSIQPGQPFWVAVKMDHDPHWHSYWINAGTGYPTSINWTLPEGYTAGPIVWPAPHVVKDTAGKVTGNGYEGQVFLFTQITPPVNAAAGSTANLQAAVEWLMCKDVCMPGDAKVSLALPVTAEKTGENTSIARLFNNAFFDLPTKPDGWTLSAQRDGVKITLRLKPATGNTHQPEGLHYFDENAVVDYAAEQAVREENGVWVLELVADAAAPADSAGLKGILVAKNGFKPASGYGGIHVDVKFGAEKTVAAAGAQPAAAGPQLPSTAVASGSLISTLFLALIGGLILNLMPCVFPVLGIKIMGFVNQSGSDKAKVVQHGLAFTLGVLVSFWVLAGLLLFLRAGGSQLGWGFQLQSPAFVFGMAVFLLIFALNLSGLFEVGLSATGAGAELQSKEGLTGSFFTGALATLVATPCSAPFLAPALGAALSLAAVESILVFTAIAVGLALPYLLLSIFPQAIRLLPKPGAWMETFKQFMAFPLYATVGWLLWVLAGQTQGDDHALLNIAFAFVLVAMAAWAYGRFGQAFGKPVKQNIGRVLAALFLVTGLWLGWPQEAKAATTADGKPAAPQIADWEKWSPAAVDAALAAGRPVYVDFTARWCATCQTNKKVVFASQEVVDTFIARNVVRLKADWTNRDAAITEALAKWNRSAVPFNLIYWPGRKDPVILPELLTPGIVLEHLAKAERG
jgi:thiol:disulfide interchange protein